MALGGGLQAAIQRLVQQNDPMGGDFDASQFPNQAPTPPGGPMDPLDPRTNQAIALATRPVNPYSQYASLPTIQPTAEETQFETGKAKGADKHTGGFGSRLKDALKAFGFNLLGGLEQGNLLGGLAGGIAGGIGNMISPQLIHNQMAAQNLANLQAAAQQSRQLADQRMNQQMALGKYQQEGARIGLEGAAQEARWQQLEFENARQMAEIYRQMGLPIPPQLAAKLNQPGLAGKTPYKEPQFITGPDGILRHKETMQPVIAPETGQPMQAKEARRSGFTLGGKRYEP